MDILRTSTLCSSQSLRNLPDTFNHKVCHQITQRQKHAVVERRSFSLGLVVLGVLMDKNNTPVMSYEQASLHIYMYIYIYINIDCIIYTHY